MTENKSLQFSALPLAEVAVRATLTKAFRLTFNRVWAIHEALKEKLPEVTEPSTIEQVPGVSQLEITPFGGGLPGARFLDSATGISITLQGQLIAAHWVKRAVGPGFTYPRYQAMRSILWDTAAKIDEIEPSGVSVVNMVYVNLLTMPRGATSADVSQRMLSPRYRVPALDEAKRIYGHTLNFQDPNDVDLRLEINVASWTILDAVLNGYRLATAGGKKMEGGLSEAATNLDLVHSRLQGFFDDIMSDEARKEWGLQA